MSDEQQDLTHPASPIRLEQARRDSDVANSVELGAALQNLGGLLAILLTLGGIAIWMKSWTREVWSGGVWKVANVPGELQSTSLGLASALAPLMLLLVLAALLSHWLQSGFVFKLDRVFPRWDRLGSARMQQPGKLRKMLVSLLSLPKMLISIGLTAALIWYQRDQFFELVAMSAEQQVAIGFGLVLRISFQVALLLLLFGAVDFGMEKYAHLQRLQMSDQQLRDEQRMQQGDPLVQARLQQRQQELMGRRGQG